MSLATRRGPLTCNCRQGCPPYTWPLSQYFVTWLDSAGNPTLGYNGRLMRWPAVNFPLNDCNFRAVQPVLPFILELLSFGRASCAAGQDGWTLQFIRSIPLVPTEVWSLTTCWDVPSPIPIDPNSSISCSQVRIELPGVFPVGSTSMLVEAAYPNACDSSDYPRKVQSPWHHLTPRS